MHCVSHAHVSTAEIGLRHYCFTIYDKNGRIWFSSKRLTKISQTRFTVFGYGQAKDHTENKTCTYRAIVLDQELLCLRLDIILQYNIVAIFIISGLNVSFITSLLFSLFPLYLLLLYLSRICKLKSSHSKFFDIQGGSKKRITHEKLSFSQYWTDFGFLKRFWKLTPRSIDSINFILFHSVFLEQHSSELSFWK